MHNYGRARAPPQQQSMETLGGHPKVTIHGVYTQRSKLENDSKNQQPTHKREKNKQSADYSAYSHGYYFHVHKG